MIIGVSGLAGSGKDTVADILVKHRQCVKISFADPLKRICQDVFQFSNEQLWGPSASRNAPDFRYMVGEGYAEAYEKHKETNPELAASYARSGWLTPRVALQLLGTEWGRHCYDTIWVDYALRTSKTVLGSHNLMYTPQEGIAERFAYGGCGYEKRDDAPPDGGYAGVIIPDVRFKNEVRGLKAAGAKLIRVVRPGAGLKGAAAQHQSETEQLKIPDEDFDSVIRNEESLEVLEAAVLRAWAQLSTESSPSDLE
jgi:hypothetical protein